MDVYPITSALMGPSAPTNENVKLHRLFEQNEQAYSDNLAIIHEGTYKNSNNQKQL